MPLATAERLRRDIEALKSRSAEAVAVPKGRVEFARSAGLYPDDWQRDALASEAPRQLYNCSRQSGKSSVAAVIAVHTALAEPSSLILLLSPGLRQSQELFKKCADAYHAAGSPVPEAARSALRLALLNGSRIVCLPSTETTVRGYSSVRALIVDEASRVPDELYRAARPFLAVSGGRLLALSTPAGKRGWWFHEWSEGVGWERYEISAPQVPRISEEFLSEERATLPDRIFRQEYLCEFTEVDDQLFSYDTVEQSITSEVRPLWAS